MRFSDPKAMLAVLSKSLKETSKQALLVRSKALWHEIKLFNQALRAQPGNIHMPAIDMGPINKGARLAAAQEKMMAQRARFPDLALRESAPADHLQLKFRAGDEVLLSRPQPYSGEFRDFAQVGVEHEMSDSWYRRPGSKYYQRTHKDRVERRYSEEGRAVRALTLAGERNVTTDSALIVHGVTDDGSAILRKRGELPKRGHTVSASLVSQDHTGTFTASGYVYPYNKNQVHGAFTHDVSSVRLDDTGERAMNNGSSPLLDRRNRSPGYVGAVPHAQRSAGYWQDGMHNYNELFYRVDGDPTGVFVKKDKIWRARPDVLQAARDRGLPVMMMHERGITAMSADDFFAYRDRSAWWSDQRRHPRLQGKSISQAQTVIRRSMGPDATFFDQLDWGSFSDQWKEHVLGLRPGRTFRMSGGGLRESLASTSKLGLDAVPIPFTADLDIKTWNPLPHTIGRK